MDILQGLNAAQREAVETIEGPLLILAGPGSGKTRVITHRIAYLVRVVGINPRRIMAVTFTNKAAREMRDRLQVLLAGSVEHLSVSTFHAACAAILRRDGQAIGLSPKYAIYDDEDQLNVMKRSLQDLGLDPKKFPPKTFQNAISAAKSQLITADEYARRAHSYFEEVVARVYQQYDLLLAQSQALDFDDLLMKAYQLFSEHPDILARYQSRYLHLLIDEFQDTNVTQYALARQIAGKHRNICVVGDPDQSIYSWRNADLRNILSFERDYPSARVVYLEQNYRSTKTILEAAHQVVAVNKGRKENALWTDNEEGLPVRVVETFSEFEEAQFVVSEVANLLEQGEARHMDCAVMYRTNAQSRALEEAFVRYGIPYQVVGSVRFYSRREIKDVVAYLKLIYNPWDSVSLTRIINVPPRGIGQKTLEELQQWTKGLGLPLWSGLQRLAEDKASSPFSPRSTQALASFYAMIEELARKSQEVNVVELIDAVLRASGYKDYTLEQPDGDDRWDNVLELRGIAGEYRDLKPPEGLASFLESVSLFSDTDELDEKKDVVTLITLHQAKGLEYPVVFIVGMEEGVLPHIKSFDDPAQMEEERRLCYVGMTRAKKRLYLVRALRRSLMGGTNANPPSRFLRDIPENLVQASGLFGEEPKPAPKPKARGPDLSPGDHVQHARFGKGTVVSCTPARDDHEVVVVFDGVGIKKLLLSLAQLKPLD
ncbi:MAG: UvrD-helicase domain-containing protein [Dehalococcoidia bacterium]|nr:UvrD-helicase domain-containing protein [Dehalococcoidia bacterium]